MLRLPTGSPIINHHSLGHHSGNVWSEVLFNQGDSKVNSGGHSCGGLERSVLDENAIFLDGHCWCPWNHRRNKMA